MRGLVYIILAGWGFAAGAETIPHSPSAQAPSTRPEVEGASLYSSVPIGFDTHMKYGRRQFRTRNGSTVIQSLGNACVSTLIARIPDADGVTCKAAFISADHCIRGQNREPLVSWDVSLPGMPKGEAVAILNKPGRIASRRKDIIVGYDNRGNPIDDGVEDVAVIRAEMPCAYLGTAKPARLAACDAKGSVILGEQERLVIQKRKSAEGENRGGGGRFMARLANGVKNLFGRSLYSMRALRNNPFELVKGGDSGGPIANQRGEIVSVMARASERGEQSYFDPKAVCFARAKLVEWEMWPPVPEGGTVPNTKPTQVAPQAIADTSVPGGAPVATSTQAFVGIDQDAAGKKRLVFQLGRGVAHPIFARKIQDGSTEWLWKSPTTGRWEKLPTVALAKLEEFYRPFAESRARFEQVFVNATDRSLVQGFLKPQWASQPRDSFASVVQPPSPRQPSLAGPGTGPNVGPVVANVGGAAAAARTPAQSQAISTYENMQYWVDDGTYPNGKRKLKSVGARERYHAISPNEFADVPVGGTGKVIVAHFGNPRRDLQNLLAAQPKEIRDLIEVRNYPLNGPEHKEAALFRVNTLAIDGLGRKISRYPMDASEVLKSFLNGTDGNQELARLKAYREAKGSNPVNPAHSPSANANPNVGASAQPGLSSQENSVRSRGPSSSSTVETLHSGLAKCASCHSGNPSLGSSFKTVEGLKPFLRSMPSDLLSSMIARGPAAGHGLTEEEKAALFEYRAVGSVGSASSGHFAGVSAATNNTNEGGIRQLASVQPIPACLTDEATREAKIQALPSIAHGSPLAERLKQASQGRRLVFYDKNNRPKTWLGSSFGHSVHLKNSANLVNTDSFQRFGYHGDSGAREFPWANPAGTDISPGVSSEKFVIPPDNGASARLITRNVKNSPTYFGSAGNRRAPQMGWEYQPGATLGEVLKVTNPATGEAIPFEVRLRQKLSNGQWTMDVLRPFENSADLAQSLQRLCEGTSAPAGCAQVGGALAALQYPKSQQVRREAYVNKNTFGTRHDPLAINRTAHEALSPVATVQVMPELPADVVAALLKSTPFKSVFGKPWATDANGGNPGWAPSSASSFSIVPKNYFGAFIPTTQESCMKCHDSAGRHVDQFEPDRRRFFFPDPTDAPRPRTWYNWMQGNDGILSLHPYSTQAIQRGAVPSRNAVDPCLLQSFIFQ